MAATNVAAVVIPTTFFPALPVGAGSLTLTPQAADVANGNYSVVSNAKTLVLAINTDASAHTVTVTSVAAAGDNRTGDVTTYSIAAGGVGRFGPFTLNGWAGSDPVPNAVKFSANDATVKFVVLTLP